MPIQLAPNVYWVGAIDWDIREFHGYVTERGSTYNAFLILDDKITLIDTVKKEFLPEMLARVAESRSNVVLAEALVPLAISKAFRAGRLRNKPLPAILPRIA